FILFIFILLLNNGLSQTPTLVNKLNIVSPNAASLGKFVDIPVNYHTGIPQISIPLYTIESGNLKIPISIDYHAGGIKVGEQASRVGLGWALNAGGVIMRQVKGLPDEAYTQSYRQKYGYLTNAGYLSFLDSINDGANIPDLADFEPDMFTFNFNGYSGKFVINDDGNPVLFPMQDLKIEYDYPNSLWLNNLNQNINIYGWTSPQGATKSSIRSFTITTMDGTKYYFGAQDAYPNGYSHPIDVSVTFQSENYSLPTIVSSWYLNKIVTADGANEIIFYYTYDNYSYYSYNQNRSTPSQNSSSANSPPIYPLIKKLFFWF
ncbi:MAG: hypothetical protein ORN85_02595, partial [Sediminibacterium sp.]|nr:hypothetical protein [Sediminibacterium sp.]